MKNIIKFGALTFFIVVAIIRMDYLFIVIPLVLYISIKIIFKAILKVVRWIFNYKRVDWNNFPKSSNEYYFDDKYDWSNKEVQTLSSAVKGREEYKDKLNKWEFTKSKSSQKIQAQRLGWNVRQFTGSNPEEVVKKIEDYYKDYEE